jgi:hypothetical protein
MTKHPATSCVLAAFLALSCLSIAWAQDPKYPTVKGAKPMYTRGPNHYELAPKNPAASLIQWTGSFTDLKGATRTFTMIGTDPTATNTSTTIPVYIIPIRMVYPKSNGDHTFDPVKQVLPNGKTVIQNIVASPIFDPGVNFTQGGKNLGTTQYLDAYQRGNFWKFVKTKKHSGYHVLLGQPTILAEQTITVKAAKGTVISNPFGSGIAGTYDIGAFDTKLQAYMRKFAQQISPGVLPLFVTYDVYLTSGGCCYGGYHNANGPEPAGQTYAYATYVDSVGAFAQDVSALSHEIGEWMDDPFADNAVGCTDNNLMEVGDPLENNPNSGAYPYTLNGFTYNLQSLVFIGYFGAPPTDSVNRWLSFQNDESHVCPGQ